jgi:hypothetical protein
MSQAPHDMNSQERTRQLLSSPPELLRITEYGEAEAWAELQGSLPLPYREATGTRVRRFGSAVALVATNIDSILFNRVIGLGVYKPCTQETIDHIIALYSSHGKAFALQLAPSVGTEELESLLALRGFVRADAWAKVIRRAAGNIDIPTEFRIERIGPERASLFGATASGGFGVPLQMSPGFSSTVGHAGWQHYLAYEGDTPVATGSLFVAGEIGWLGIGSTLPSHRGRGAQGALMARRIRDAAALGCEWVVTETGEDRPDGPNPSYHNMMRCGFQLAYNRRNYILRPEP